MAVPVLQRDDLLRPSSGPGCVAKLAVEPLGLEMLEFLIRGRIFEEIVSVETEQLRTMPNALVRVFGFDKGPPFVAGIGGSEC